MAKEPQPKATPKTRERMPTELEQAKSGERSWKIAQLAGALFRGDHPQLGVQNLASKKWDDYFAAALKRAESLLEWTEGKRSGIHAYQLFEEGQCYTEGAIKDVFHAFGWSGLQSKQSVMELMASLRQRFDDLIEDTEDQRIVIETVGPALIKDIDEAIVRAFKVHINENLPEWASGLRSNLRSTLSEIIASNVNKPSLHDIMYEDAWQRAFHAWCFPHPPDSSKAERLYRPYEIFRRCAKEKWDESKLIRSELAEGKIPHPTIDLCAQYRIFEEMCSELIIPQARSTPLEGNDKIFVEDEASPKK